MELRCLVSSLEYLVSNGRQVFLGDIGLGCSAIEARVLMGEVHEGICGAHQSAYKIKWVIRRSTYF